MQTNSLKRIHPNTKRMTVARGGKRGKTAGRGGKGQTARAGNKRRPEWRDIIKKLPKLRGRGVNSNKTPTTQVQRPVAVNLIQLDKVFKAGENVSPAILVEKGVISIWSGKVPRVKILGTGEITIALKFSGVTVSDTAKAAIIKAGGTIADMPKANAFIEAPVREAQPEAKKEAKAPEAPKAEKKVKKPAAKK